MICGHYSLGQLNLSLINEANRPKLLRYQRECAKVLARYWRQRDLIDAYLLPGFRKYEDDGDNAGLCQLSRHDGEAGHVNGSDRVYAAAIIPINWENRS